MKTLSLYQPWATLVVVGAKKFETRSWATKYRGPLLIHASKKFTEADRELVFTHPFFEALGRPLSDSFPTGAIIGRVEFIDCITTEKWFLDHTFKGEKLQDGSREIFLDPKYLAEYEFGDYSYGRFAWKLRNPQKFDKPIPARGSLGIWEFPESALGHLPEKILS